MIRPYALFASVLSLAVLSVSGAAAQQSAAPEAPSAPASKTAPVFPKPDPANFTAAQPTKETIDAFLNASWGYDENRIWQVQAVLKTPAEGVSKVIVLVGDKSAAQQTSGMAFFVLPDGKHLIAGDSLISFGEKPYTEARALLQQRADGPYRGAAAKDLEIVEFTDFQCPHCKEAQANMEKLAVDFPKARIVFQNLPLKAIHPAAEEAAKYSICVNKLGGSASFLTFSAAVFDGQSGLATTDGATLTLNSAVVKAGLEPAKVAACAAEPATAKIIDASVQLGTDLNIEATPTLMINGRPVGATAPYDTLKKIVAFQAKLDGVAQ